MGLQPLDTGWATKGKCGGLWWPLPALPQAGGPAGRPLSWAEDGGQADRGPSHSAPPSGRAIGTPPAKAHQGTAIPGAAKGMRRDSQTHGLLPLCRPSRAQTSRPQLLRLQQTEATGAWGPEAQGRACDPASLTSSCGALSACPRGTAALRRTTRLALPVWPPPPGAQLLVEAL